ncbi:ASCH domain-containing protein [Pseudonocardiaceae bacterium YIM PH 21723]|nr:ASCH domain-containing protein [Pseudonocardiaceae bacterium YIM PH 21723]
MWGRIDGLRVMELGTPGPLRDQLNALVLAGLKKATAGLLKQDYWDEGEELPAPGEIMVLVDSREQRLAELRTTSVEVLPMHAVTWEFAQAEGEGFRDIEHWRAVHTQFWAAAGHVVDADTAIVCEHFELVTGR